MHARLLRILFRINCREWYDRANINQSIVRIGNNDALFELRISISQESHSMFALQEYIRKVKKLINKLENLYK